MHYTVFCMCVMKRFNGEKKIVWVPYPMWLRLFWLLWFVVQIFRDDNKIHYRE